MSDYEETNSNDKEDNETYSNDKEDIYSDEGRESAVDDDEISSEEDGFMKGYEDYEE